MREERTPRRGPADDAAPGTRGGPERRSGGEPPRLEVFEEDVHGPRDLATIERIANDRGFAARLTHVEDLGLVPRLRSVGPHTLASELVETPARFVDTRVDFRLFLRCSHGRAL